jgi:hypothetical protein
MPIRTRDSGAGISVHVSGTGSRIIIIAIHIPRSSYLTPRAELFVVKVNPIIDHCDNSAFAVA